MSTQLCEHWKEWPNANSVCGDPDFDDSRLLNVGRWFKLLLEMITWWHVKIGWWVLRIRWNWGLANIDVFPYAFHFKEVLILSKINSFACESGVKKKFVVRWRVDCKNVHFSLVIKVKCQNGHSLNIVIKLYTWKQWVTKQT